MSDCNWLHVIKTEGNKPQTKGDERVHKVGTHHDPSSRAFPSLHKFHTCCWSSWFPLVPSLGSLQSTSVAYSLEAFSILSSILQNMSELRSFPMFYLYVCVCVCTMCTWVWVVGAYAYTHVYTTEKNIECPALSLWLILLRQRVSLNLELGCLAVSSPPAFTPREFKLQAM